MSSDNQHKSLPLVSALFSRLTPRRRWQFAVVIVLMIVGALAELASLGAVIPFLTLLAEPLKVFELPIVGQHLANYSSDDPSVLIFPATVIFAAIVLLAMFVRLALSAATNIFAFGVGYDIGVGVYQKTLWQPYWVHAEQNTSEVIAGINKTQMIVFGAVLPLMQGFVSLVLATAVALMLFTIDPLIAGVSSLLLVGIYVLVSLATKSMVRLNGELIAKSQTKRVQVIQEGLGGIRDVILDGLQKVYVRRFMQVDGPMRRAQAINNLIGATPRFVVEAALMLLIALIGYYLAVDRGGLLQAIPVLGAMALGAQKLVPMLQVVYQGWTKFSGNKALLADVLELLDRTSSEMAEDKSNEPELTFEESLTLDGVSYRFRSSDVDVLSNINFTVEKGKTVGLVGETGSGKSTLLDIVMGLLQPTLGKVLIDGHELTSENRDGWLKRVAHVPQTIYLSDASIGENIALGVNKAAIDHERMREAANLAQVSQFIEGLPLKYDTAVGERGVRLSGGQRQRIGIARALYKRAEILILDEATSALDDKTEKSLMSALREVSGGMTIFMVAHRIPTLEHCDDLIVLNKGRITGVVSYKDFINTSRVEIG